MSFALIPQPRTLIRVLVIFMLLSALLAGVQPAHAATFAVTKTVDTSDGACDADCSLREAIAAAEVTAGPDDITLPAGTYTLTLGSELLVTTDLTLNGAGAATTIIQANAWPRTATYRVLRHDGGTLTISGVTIRHGVCWSYPACEVGTFGGGIYNQAGALTLTDSTVSDNLGLTGGGICNQAGALTLTHSTVSANTGGGQGGGIYNEADTLTLNASIISDNRANYGGGIYNQAGTLTLDANTISANRTNAGTGGGGIYNAGSIGALTNSTFFFNGARGTAGGGGQGGAIHNVGSIETIANSTFSDNWADNGGGFYNEGRIEMLANSTFSGNRATNGGGFYNEGGTVTLANTIIANSTGGGDCVIGTGSVTDGGHNLIEDGGCGIANPYGDPSLGPLADNGGPTQTHALLPGSPAIDSVGGTCGLTTDQRGMPRDLQCDIGAYEDATMAVLTTAGAGPGSGTLTGAAPSTLNCTSTTGATSGTCTESLALGTHTVTAAALPGSTFAGWAGCTLTSGANNEICTIVLNADTTITASFNLAPVPPITGGGSGPGLSPLIIDVLVEPHAAQVGDIVLWTITVSNPGPAPTGPVTVTGIFPADLRPLPETLTTTRGAAALDGLALTVSGIETLNPGEQVVITARTEVVRASAALTASAQTMPICYTASAANASDTDCLNLPTMLPPTGGGSPLETSAREMAPWALGLIAFACVLWLARRRG